MHSKKSLLITLLLFVLHIVVSYTGMLKIYAPYSVSEVSGMYPHLLTPAGFTFAIWGVIYLGLAVQWVFHWRTFETTSTSIVANAIGNRLAFVHLATIAWLVAWCNAWLLVANILIVIQLVLIINALIRVGNTHPKGAALWLSATPLAIYAGWLCIATVANTACTLAAHQEISLPAQSIAKLVVVVVALIAMVTLFQTRLLAFALPILWACWGIHEASQNQVNAGLRYTLVAAMVLVAGTIVLLLFSIYKRYASSSK